MGLSYLASGTNDSVLVVCHKMSAIQAAMRGSKKSHAELCNHGKLASCELEECESKSRQCQEDRLTPIHMQWDIYDIDLAQAEVQAQTQLDLLQVEGETGTARAKTSGLLLAANISPGRQLYFCLRLYY